jgi:hypothetical protein
MANSTTTQIVREAPELEAYKLGLMKTAQNLQMPTLPSYQVASLSPQQRAAIEQGQQGIGAYQPFMNAGSQNLGDAASYYRAADTTGQFGAARDAYSGLSSDIDSAGQAYQNSLAGFNQAQNTVGQATGQFDPTSVNKFMNPYQQQVIDAAMQEMNRQGAMQQMAAQGNAASRGAFGGTRQALQQAELGRGLAQTQNAAIVNALQQGYGQAMGQAQNAYEAQQGRRLAAGQAMGNLTNQQGALGLQSAGQQASMRQAMGQGIGSLATQQSAINQNIAQGLGTLGVQQGTMGQLQQQLGQNDSNFLYNLGSIQQKQQQAILDAQRATALQNAYQPYQQLAFISDIYKGAPSTQMAVTSASQPSPSPFQQVTGAGTGLLATGAAANKLGLL